MGTAAIPLSLLLALGASSAATKIKGLSLPGIWAFVAVFAIFNIVLSWNSVNYSWDNVTGIFTEIVADELPSDAVWIADSDLKHFGELQNRGGQGAFP